MTQEFYGSDLAKYKLERAKEDIVLENNLFFLRLYLKMPSAYDIVCVGKKEANISSSNQAKSQRVAALWLFFCPL